MGLHASLAAQDTLKVTGAINQHNIIHSTKNKNMPYHFAHLFRPRHSEELMWSCKKQASVTLMTLSLVKYF